MTEQDFLILLGEEPSAKHLAQTLDEFLRKQGWHDMARKVWQEIIELGSHVCDDCED